MVRMPCPRLIDALRRAVDILFAAVALVTAAPVLGLASLLISLEDGGPVLHRRRVLGRGGTEFDAYKLRTMRVDADLWLAGRPDLFERYQSMTKLANDPRVTRPGRILRRFHIDELPQFVNVLAGQMSVVGPRMIHPSELGRFGDFGRERLTIRPGVTGLWQVSRSGYDYDERLALDLLYLRNRSIRL